jgi:hypothetical protein
VGPRAKLNGEQFSVHVVSFRRGGPWCEGGKVPVGYLVSVALVALVTLFALVPLRSVGNLSFRLGLLLNEVPIVGFYWLLIWTSLAFVQGDINSVGGWATVGLAALTTWA